LLHSNTFWHSVMLTRYGTFVPAPHLLYCFSLLLHVLFLFCVSFLGGFVLLWNWHMCCWAKTLINTCLIGFIVIIIVICALSLW
jgi:hypothetical protein